MNVQDGARICLVTPGHPATDPRLVKEADALVEAGYRVRVVATRFVAWATATEAEFAGRPWGEIAWARIGPFAPWPARQAMRIRRRLLQPLAVRAPHLSAWLTARAWHDAIPQLIRLARAEPADLYIAHNLAALPAAAAAARRHKGRLGFDAEDFHRGELAATPENRAFIRLASALEQGYMPRCDHLTAASDGIARAYAEALGIEPPVTILNAFALTERHGTTPAAELEAERRGPGLSLYWFGQTIGPGRGLEMALDAMARAGPGLRLHLRGNWAAGYEKALHGRAVELGLADRVHHLPPVPPGQLVERTARHDVGLALEPGDRPNSNLMTTNKILTYLVAGLALAATDTEGQQPVMAGAPGAGLTCRPGDVAALTAWLRTLIEAPERLQAARAAALTAAETRFSWERQKPLLLERVAETLAARPRTLHG